MKSPRIWWVATAVFVCLMIFRFTYMQGPNDTAPSEQEGSAGHAGAKIDENLFMVHLLDNVYMRLPDSQATREEVQTSLGSIRQNVAWALQVIRSRELDKDVDTMYQDYLRLLDAYENYLFQIGVLDKQHNTAQFKDAVASVVKGFQSSAELERNVQNLGASKDNAETVGGFGGLISGVLDYNERLQKTDEAHRAAVAAYQRDFDEIRQDILLRTQSFASRLTKSHGWQVGEAGFDNFQNNYLIEYLKRRPRDPFLKIRYANKRVDKETPEDVLHDAYLCSEATELVPGSDVYDAYRNQFFANATDLALLAASRQAGVSGYSGLPEMAGISMSFAARYLEIDPQDETGRGHVSLARALAFSGRFGEAVETATEAIKRAPDLWRKDGVFCFRYAAMLSLGGHDDLVGGWLSLAYDNGFNYIRMIRANQDFDLYRKARGEEYSKLTTVKVSHEIVFGLLNDDIVLTNNSPFSLTNLHVVMTIRSGQRVWNPEIDCDFVPAGRTCAAVNVVSIPNDSYDEATGTIECDQCKM